MKKGFTLIEVLVYLALYSIIIAGAVVSAYNLLESAGRNETKVMVEEEGGYLLGKLSWELNSGDASPVFASAGGNILLSQGGAPPEILNSRAVQVSDFILTGTTTSFMLSALTPQGAVYSENFYVFFTQK